MEILHYFLCFLIGYLLGSVSPSYIMAKIKGFDIRQKGSKNCGTSNAFLTMGIKSAVVVCLLDLLKVFVAVLISFIFFKDLKYFHIVTAFSAVVGHMHPFYLGFKAGKGFACLIATMFVVNFWFGLVVIVVAMTLALLSNYIVVATLIVLISTSIFIPVYTNFDLVPTIISTVICCEIFIKHIPNIINIIKGEEFHIYTKKKKE